MPDAAIWIISAVSIVLMLIRPRQWPEAVWPVTGACLLVVSGLLPPIAAGQAVAKGTDVYLFLTGMLVIAELARREGVFDWIATYVIAAAKGSRLRLFVIVYVVGVLVTVFFQMMRRPSC